MLDQVQKPDLVVCDTMNFWISGKRDALVKLLERVDVFVLNETEAKMLADETNPIRAAKAIAKMGPKRVVMKLGEYGVQLLGDGKVYRLPAYPVSEVHDPTGAGDSFAGGFVGSLCESADHSFEGMHRALLAGTVCASFNVESFSMERLRSIDRQAVDERCRELEHIAGWSWNGAPVRG